MKSTLLLAEGDPELCDVYQRFLTAGGYEVETASDGLGCLAKLRRQMPAVLVLDFDLRWGGSDGVLAWLREQSAESGVPVVLMTTGCNRVDVAPEIKPSVVKVLPKPFTMTTLLENVRAAIADQAREEPFYGFRAATYSELFIG